MAPLKFAALALGSLAVLQGARANGEESQTPAEQLGAREYLNLFRNAKIDVRLPDLEGVDAGTAEAIAGKVTSFVKETEEEHKEDRKLRTRENSASTDTKKCTVVEGAEKLGLVLAIPNGETPNYGAMLDTALEVALPSLLADAKANDTTPSSDEDKAKVSSIKFLSSETPTHIGCGITTKCTNKYLFCMFAKSASASTFLKLEEVTVTKAFAEAVDARKKAEVKLSELKLTDANTPLTSGVSKVALSALAALAVAAQALPF